MAKADIDLTVGLDIPDSEVTTLTKKLNSITNGFKKDLKDVFSSVTPGTLVGGSFSGTADVISKYNKIFNKNLRESVMGEMPVYSAGEIRAMNQFRRLKRFATSISKFEKIPERAEEIAQQTKSGKSTPAQSLGAYGITQKRLGHLVNTLLKANYFYPDLITDTMLESAESSRQTFLNIGNSNRAASRYSQNKELWSSAVSRTMKYIMNTNPEMVSLNDYFGLGFNKDARVKTYSDKAFDLITEEWSAALSKIKEGKERLEDKSLPNRERDKILRELNANANKLVVSGKKLGADVYGLSKTIKEETKDFIDSTTDVAIASKGAMGVIGSIVGVAANSLIDYEQTYLTSKWSEQVSRNVYDSRRAQEIRKQSAAKNIGAVGGGIIGAIGGGIAGFFTGGPVGAVAGSVIGAGAGAKRGGDIGSTYGEYGKTMLESDIKSVSQMSQRLRAKSLYGSDYNTFFAQAITDSGIANGEAAMGHLAGSAQAMRGRMMLGQVGEQEMLYMSMMPNYYAALMNGVTGPELARIYAEDLNNIGDPSLRYVVGNALGGQDAYVMGSNKYFASNFDKFYANAAEAEAKASNLEYGYAMTQAHVARKNTLKVSRELVKTAFRGDSAAFNKRYASIMSESPAVAKSSVESAIDQVFTGKSERPINVYFQVDGQTVAEAVTMVDSTKTDTIYLQNGFVGG